MSDIDRAELRRLLAESARPGEVFRVAHGHHYSYAVHDRAGWTVAECAGENWAHLIAAAVNALPGLLDALEKAEEHRDSLAATLIEVQREKQAAAADLLPAESVALTVALAQLLRGDESDPNVASMCILALARITGRHDWTSGVNQPSSRPAVTDPWASTADADAIPADPDAELINALREASWRIEHMGARPDPLPGLREARDLLTELRELGWTVIRTAGGR